MSTAVHFVWYPVWGPLEKRCLPGVEVLFRSFSQAVRLWVSKGNKCNKTWVYACMCMLFCIYQSSRYGFDFHALACHPVKPFSWLALSFAQASLPTLAYQTAEGEGGRCLCRVATALLVLAF